MILVPANIRVDQMVPKAGSAPATPIVCSISLAPGETIGLEYRTTDSATVRRLAAMLNAIAETMERYPANLAFFESEKDDIVSQQAPIDPPTVVKTLGH
jgi:hypothetical protein